MNRAAAEELLLAGWSIRRTAKAVQTREADVRRLRDELGIPAGKPGPRPAGSVEDIFWRRAVPTDDGHLIWPGLDARDGGHINHAGRSHAVHRVAFRIRYCREPVGQVRTGCNRPGCVHPNHVEDQPMRQQYTAIFGTAA